MTDEEILKTIQELSDDIEKLSDPDKPITKDEKNRKCIMKLKKDTLLKIQEAREKSNSSLEMRHLVNYGLLDSMAEKHPFLTYFLQAKFRMNIF